jgi:hypothetical protein
LNAVTMKLERLPDVLGLQAGSLDDPSMYRPVMEVFTSSAQLWDHMDPKVQNIRTPAVISIPRHCLAGSLGCPSRMLAFTESFEV